MAIPTIIKRRCIQVFEPIREKKSEHFKRMLSFQSSIEQTDFDFYNPLFIVRFNFASSKPAALVLKILDDEGSKPSR